MTTGYDKILGAINIAIADTEYINTKKAELIDAMKSCYVELIKGCTALIALQDFCFSLNYRLSKSAKFVKSHEYDCFTNVMTRTRTCERKIRINKSKFAVFMEDCLALLEKGFDSLEKFRAVQSRINQFISSSLKQNEQLCDIGCGLGNEIILIKKIVSITKY